MDKDFKNGLLEGFHRVMECKIDCLGQDASSPAGLLQAMCAVQAAVPKSIDDPFDPKRFQDAMLAMEHLDLTGARPFHKADRTFVLEVRLDLLCFPEFRDAVKSHAAMTAEQEEARNEILKEIYAHLLAELEAPTTQEELAAAALCSAEAMEKMLAKAGASDPELVNAAKLLAAGFSVTGFEDFKSMLKDQVRHLHENPGYKPPGLA